MRRVEAILLALCLAGCQAPQPARQPPQPVKPKAAPVKILHFYAASYQVMKGERTTLCYGVENAKSVRIEPPVEQLKPGYNRCFQVTPQHSVSYRLVAEGSEGSTSSQSVKIEVQPVPQITAAPAALQRLITMIFASAPETSAGEPVTLCYGAPDAASITVEPAVQELKPAARFCFAVAPDRTTTYTLTGHAKDGHIETAELTVKVR